MPVTIEVARHAARKYEPHSRAHSTDDILRRACKDQARTCKRIIQSSLTDTQLAENCISPSTNGFVWAAFQAYSYHHHLTLRPEDVWFAILSQLGFFVNAHAEELRSFFVDHEGAMELEVFQNAGEPLDFGELAFKMTDLIAKNVIDPELKTFIMPSFSTTTDTDRAVAAVLMMGALQKYFRYAMHTMCGIPSVTLLGERSDWENMLDRLDRLPRLGAEPAQFAALLRPVLRHFVATFDDPTGAEVVDFWNKIAHHSGGSGVNYLSGWLTAFCFWNEEGTNLFEEVNGGNGPKAPVNLDGHAGGNAGCELDGVLFHRLDSDRVPSGCASVPVLVDNTIKTTMVAGSFAIAATSSGQLLDGAYDHLYEDDFEEEVDEYIPQPPTQPAGLDTVQPISGWLMFERDVEKEEEAYQKSEKMRSEHEQRNSRWRALREEKKAARKVVATAA